MKRLKKKPKADVMGFLCYKVSVARGESLQSRMKQDVLYPCYLYSTALIFMNFKKKYSDGLIHEIEAYCDRFYLKKHKEIKKNDMLWKREQIISFLDKENDIEAFLSWSGIRDDEQLVHEALTLWKKVPFLLDEDIKSM